MAQLCTSADQVNKSRKSNKSAASCKKSSSCSRQRSAGISEKVCRGSSSTVQSSRHSSQCQRFRTARKMTDSQMLGKMRLNRKCNNAWRVSEKLKHSNYKISKTLSSSSNWTSLKWINVWCNSKRPTRDSRTQSTNKPTPTKYSSSKKCCSCKCTQNAWTRSKAHSPRFRKLTRRRFHNTPSPRCRTGLHSVRTKCLVRSVRIRKGKLHQSSPRLTSWKRWLQSSNFRQTKCGTKNGSKTTISSVGLLTLLTNRWIHPSRRLIAASTVSGYCLRSTQAIASLSGTP